MKNWIERDDGIQRLAQKCNVSICMKMKNNLSRRKVMILSTKERLLLHYTRMMTEKLFAAEMATSFFNKVRDQA